MSSILLTHCTVYNVVLLTPGTVLYSRPLGLIHHVTETLISMEKQLISPSSSPPDTHHSTLSFHEPILDTSLCKWNHTILGLLNLAHFILCHVL